MRSHCGGDHGGGELVGGCRASFYSTKPEVCVGRGSQCVTHAAVCPFLVQSCFHIHKACAGFTGNPAANRSRGCTRRDWRSGSCALRLAISTHQVCRHARACVCARVRVYTCEFRGLIGPLMLRATNCVLLSLSFNLQTRLLSTQRRLGRSTNFKKVPLKGHLKHERKENYAADFHSNYKLDGTW